MSSKKKGQLTRFCRIFQWIDQQDHDFAEAIREMCLEGRLAPGGRHPGVTFLYPLDSKFRERIVNLVYSDSADKAIEIISSLIIPEALVRGSDFKAQPVGSLLGVHYEVTKATDSKVELAGCTLTPAPTFRPIAMREGNIAVWLLGEGHEPPLKGGEFKPRRAQRGPHGAAKGHGADSKSGAGEASALARLSNLAEVHKATLAAIEGGVLLETHPYLVALCNFIMWLEDVERSPAPGGPDGEPSALSPADSKNLLDVIHATVDYCPITSYFLVFEPHLSRLDQILVPDPVFNLWNQTTRSCTANAAGHYLGFLAGGRSYAEGGFGEAVGKIDRAREEVTNTNTLLCFDKVTKVYEEALAAGGWLLKPEVRAVLSAPLEGGGKPKKLFQDTFRHLVGHRALDVMRCAKKTGKGGGPRSHLHAATAYSCLYAAAEQAMACSTALLGLGPQKPPAIKDCAALECMAFANSTNFLYTTVPPDSVGGWGEATNPMSVDGPPFNANCAHLRYLTTVEASLEVPALDPDTVKLIGDYVKRNGWQQLQAAFAELDLKAGGGR